jgi:uncharacterized repeat protein (TIGR03803 family)
MLSKKLSLRLTAVSAIFAIALFVAGTRAAAQTETLLHNFANNGTDGPGPQASLIFDKAGNLYGTTNAGGAYNWGTVFELKPEAGGGWAEKTLHTFDYTHKDGKNPQANLVFDAAGNLYGTTPFGGSGTCSLNHIVVGCGIVFELMPEAGGGWVEKLVHNFRGEDGTNPYGALIIDAAGNLYGTTYAGGSGKCTKKGGSVVGCGTVFELTPAAGGTWTETVLHNFTNDGIDGTNPYAALVLDSSGNLYGTTFLGGDATTCGTPGCGTAFEVTPVAGGSWTERVLHSFSDNGDGYNPFASLTLDSAGNLYGTTYEGGNNADCPCGTAFELTPTAGGSWTETVLYNFVANGSFPYGGVVFDAVGNLYGTTETGGIDDRGTVFELTPAGGSAWTETILYSFSDTGKDGNYPVASPTLDAAGNLYGTTSGGGFFLNGTAFEIKP